MPFYGFLCTYFENPLGTRGRRRVSSNRARSVCTNLKKSKQMPKEEGTFKQYLLSLLTSLFHATIFARTSQIPPKSRFAKTGKLVLFILILPLWANAFSRPTASTMSTISLAKPHLLCKGKQPSAPNSHRNPLEFPTSIWATLGLVEIHLLMAEMTPSLPGIVRASATPKHRLLLPSNLTTSGEMKPPIGRDHYSVDRGRIYGHHHRGGSHQDSTSPQKIRMRHSPI